MKVTVQFYANIKQKVGDGELVVELEAEKRCSLLELLDEINRLIAPRLCSYDTREGDALPVRVAVNGTLIHAIEHSESEIADGDTVMIFPLLSAG